MTTPLFFAALLLASGPERQAARAALLGGHPAATAPATPAADPGLSDAELAEQVSAMLGSIDTPITPERWHALGPRAEPVLTSLVDDPEALPTRRARAVDGLAHLGVRPEATAARFARLAEQETEAFVVRLAALRGLGEVVPPEPLKAILRPLVTSAGASRVRAAAAEVLAARAPDACPEIEAQLAKEGVDAREQFHRAARQCGLSPTPSAR